MSTPYRGEFEGEKEDKTEQKRMIADKENK